MEIKAAALIDEGRGARAGKELCAFKTLQPTYQKTFSIKGLSIDEFEESFSHLFFYKSREDLRGSARGGGASLREEFLLFLLSFIPRVVFIYLL